MRYPKLRELKEAVVSLFTPAYTTRFPYEAHIPFENFRGKPVVSEEHCVGCQTCANVCPPGAITYDDNKETHTRIIVRDYGKCIFCGQCQEHCITKEGVILSDKIFDLSTFDRKSLIETQERELILCNSCSAIITTRDHLRFLYSKLGPKAFSSVLNLNMLNEHLKLAEPETTRVEVIDGLKRKDMFNILCPNCLRQVLVKDLL
ncbi:MAG: 4Fe-4S binding protein [Bacteroidales bacterium]|nr:4Fe-4S binding protein [Bacteroidales bacterium]MDZ4203777.1 4Fe-4S binding protein [Bacteroidales bacterium]